MIINSTPPEAYPLGHRTVLVKREDLCTPSNGPTFSKARGVYAHMANRPESIIGVLDTLHSKAGWCVSYFGRPLGKRVVNFWPRFKRDPADLELPRRQQQIAQAFGATMVELKAGMSAVLYNKAKKLLRESYGADAYMMPDALKLPESITENAAEVERTAGLPDLAHLVISISSGTVASGVLRGLFNEGLLDRYTVWLHQGYDRPEGSVREYIGRMTRLTGLSNVRLINEGYSYADPAPRGASAPFPCNPYYDLKAWHWLSKEISGERFADGRPIVFWNIGD